MGGRKEEKEKIRRPSILKADRTSSLNTIHQMTKRTDKNDSGKKRSRYKPHVAENMVDTSSNTPITALTMRKIWRTKT